VAGRDRGLSEEKLARSEQKIGTLGGGKNQGKEREGGEELRGVRT